VDFRALNSVTQFDPYPLPVSEETTSTLYGSKYFTVLDCKVQDGIERPIAYASRQMNTAEQRYAASEAEMLALVWATKHFLCYFYGNKFLVRTDHSALTYLQNFADQNSRLLRWSMKLSELDFVVEHRSGRV